MNNCFMARKKTKQLGVAWGSGPIEYRAAMVMKAAGEESDRENGQKSKKKKLLATGIVSRQVA